MPLLPPNEISYLRDYVAMRDSNSGSALDADFIKPYSLAAKTCRFTTKTCRRTARRTLVTLAISLDYALIQRQTGRRLRWSKSDL